MTATCPDCHATLTVIKPGIPHCRTRKREARAWCSQCQQAWAVWSIDGVVWEVSYTVGLGERRYALNGSVIGVNYD